MRVKANFEQATVKETFNMVQLAGSEVILDVTGPIDPDTGELKDGEF